MEKSKDISKSTDGDKSKGICKVLVVDDDIDFNEALCNRLGKIELQVETCRTGKEAAMKVYNNNYDLVILDILLEDTDGVQVFKKIKRLRPYLNIILISAYIQEDIVMEAMKLPATMFLEKPFEFSKLKEFITAIQKGKKK
ncbi:MAG: response regulator [Planctomycetes bacterium]|nr:response regulator [Planctomycetota bacterium]